ncbi:polyphenol oxidase family protein [uncultured Campylobacter sp.]|uniref:polyphenol oxidase family protein n=1 Tax=uncultured Campylobacter sp. TaxID=218934 RepID=UPI0025EC6000|nr:polyphenol oxidase family protein [uncultured Campylobacter sp.]
MNREILDVVFESERLKLGFTTRFGGVSEGVHEGLNLGDHVGDLPANVAKNREILAATLATAPFNLKFMRQIHSNRVEILRDLEDELPPCDGVITALRGVTLCVLVADCSPVLIADERRGVVAAVHAGRAGVTGKICTNAVRLMKSEFGCKASDLRVFVGANIKARNYEVGELDLGAFNRYKKEGKFDMEAALRDEFAQLGVGRAEFDPRCTFETGELFSYRREGVTGRFCGFVMNKPVPMKLKIKNEFNFSS